MPFRVELPNGESVRTDELSVGKVIDLAKRHETSWVTVVEAPVAGDGSLMRAMYAQFCEEHGCKVPPGMRIGQLAEAFQFVSTDEPDAESDDSDVEEDEDPPTPDAA